MKLKTNLDLIADAVAYIDENLREELTVSAICSRYPMSPWEFQRTFRAVTLDSVGNYLRTRRLSLAADLIEKSTEIKLIDVALEVGFGSPEAFSRSFKDHYGVTPFAWKKSQHRETHTKRISLNSEKIARLAKGIKGPEFIEFPARNFVGMMTTIICPFGRETDFDRRVPDLWLEFNSRRREIENREAGRGYGMALDLRDINGVESLTYFASALVSTVTAIPCGMHAMTLPPATYATFETRGTLESSHAIYDYIFGVWLPGSSYRRASLGAEVEIFDRRFRMEGDDSLSTFCIPVEKEKG